MKLPKYIIDELDRGIKDVVILLNEYGFDTFESCEGGDGHAFSEPTVLFEGSEFDCIRAYELCEQFGYKISRVKRVFRKNPLYDIHETKILGSNWVKPYNEIVFKKNRNAN